VRIGSTVLGAEGRFRKPVIVGYGMALEFSSRFLLPTLRNYKSKLCSVANMYHSVDVIFFCGFKVGSYTKHSESFVQYKVTMLWLLEIRKLVGSTKLSFCAT
jgi:hypothetical protein